MTISYRSGTGVSCSLSSSIAWSLVKVATALKGDLVGEINAKRVWRNPNGKNFIGGRLIRMKVSHYSRFAITSWADFETFCLFFNLINYELWSCTNTNAQATPPRL
jgi:hypothetical protein